MGCAFVSGRGGVRLSQIIFRYLSRYKKSVILKRRRFPASDNWIALEGLEMDEKKDAQWFFWNCEQVTDDDTSLIKKEEW
jgi:hypothetical protein